MNSQKLETKGQGKATREQNKERKKEFRDLNQDNASINGWSACPFFVFFVVVWENQNAMGCRKVWT